MIGTKEHFFKFQSWNESWGAPFGSPVHYPFPHNLTQKIGSSAAREIRNKGYFGFQPNNDTRAIEYPWAFQSASLTKGMRVLEIGGGLGGFQFVLSREGMKVDNVDPGMEDLEWPVSNEAIAELNQAFSTDVQLIKKPIHETNLKPEQYDRIFCISVLEHLPEELIKESILKAHSYLKNGGLFILTVDLFLNLFPFSTQERNIFGKNIPITSIVDESLFKIRIGNKSELYGFPDFDTNNILVNLDRYYIGHSYPVMAQMMVLEKI